MVKILIIRRHLNFLRQKYLILCVSFVYRKTAVKPNFFKFFNPLNLTFIVGFKGHYCVIYFFHFWFNLKFGWWIWLQHRLSTILFILSHTEASRLILSQVQLRANGSVENAFDEFTVQDYRWKLAFSYYLE